LLFDYNFFYTKFFEKNSIFFEEAEKLKMISVTALLKSREAKKLTLRMGINGQEAKSLNLNSGSHLASISAKNNKINLRGSNEGLRHKYLAKSNHLENF